MWPRTDLLDLLGITHPIIQAPMSGFSGPALVAAVSNAGALGSLPTNTSLNDCAGSSREGTRCKGAAIADSHSMSFIENSGFCASNACPE